MAFIEQRKALPRLEILASFAKAFDRRDVTLRHIIYLCTTKRWLSGNHGGAPFCKGWNAKGVGTERVRCGYMEVCTSKPDLKEGVPYSWEPKHRLAWEAVNGPVPAGLILKCADGDTLNCDAGNWRAVPKGLPIVMNGVHSRGFKDAPKNLKPTILAVESLAFEIRRARKKSRNG